MDTKKTLMQHIRHFVSSRTTLCLLLLVMLLPFATSIEAQTPTKIDFCDKKYEYAEGKDSITLFLKCVDENGKRIEGITAKNLSSYLVVKEDGVVIPYTKVSIRSLEEGQRIPASYTFSVLVDLTIPQEGKLQIFSAVGKLVESAPDSCVYISFFGDKVSSSELVTKANYKDFHEKFMRKAESKCFYGALYAKMAEFSLTPATFEDSVNVADGYKKNSSLQHRAGEEKDKNLLFIFTESHLRPMDEQIDFIAVTEYKATVSPRVYAFYYTSQDDVNENVINTLKGITAPRDNAGNIIKEREGAYYPADDIAKALESFSEVVRNAMYDFAYIYPATEGKVYNGEVEYTAEWGHDEIGQGTFSIGSPEHPWPVHEETTADTILKYIIALLATLLTIAFFFLVMKVLIPYIKSKTFAAKYYRKYVPEANVNVRRCTYCKQSIQPGEMIVAKCEHIMHVHCWKQNDYKCAEYGQNCKTGIQEHVDWHEMFTLSSLRDCHLTIMGIIAGLISWVIYELCGRSGFSTIANAITEWLFTADKEHASLVNDCASKVSAFLMIGSLLGFFLSLIFRYNDEYRKKDWKIYLKIVGLSLLSGVIGFAAFAIGANILCLLLSAVCTTYIPWYCSLPAYLLFSVCVSLSLTIKSTIPIKSALIGGLCSAVIGFVVLYFSSFTSARYGWMNMLLDFVIYGGGLGASLVTVRMLAEKYFLVVKNGVKAGTRIPIHKWMNATGGGNKVTIGMTGDCEIQMNWEKSNKVAKEHATLYIDHEKQLPMLKPLVTGVIYNTRAELAVGKASVLSNNDTFKIGDTIFQYVENE